MPKQQEEAFRYALAMLSELLTIFPNRPELLKAAETMDLSDELWLALRVVRMDAAEKELLRNFLLKHEKTNVLQMDAGTILIGGQRH